MYLPRVQEVLLEELVSVRKVAETGSTHQLHPPGARANCLG